jgi:hypothetical protein
MNEAMTDWQTAWVAGIIEGEGTIGWYGGARKAARLAVGMTDLDVIERLHEWTAIGSVYAATDRGLGYKPLWYWNVSAQEDFLDLTDRLAPYLLSRRSQRLLETRNEILQARLTAYMKSRVCPQGHDKDLTGVDDRGRCAACSLANQAAQKERKRKGATRAERQQVCPVGHDKDVTGRTLSGSCRICANERSRISKAEARKRRALEG